MVRMSVERDLAAARRLVEEARANLLRAMRDARAAGMTYRAIGERVGLAHETVRRMLAE